MGDVITESGQANPTGFITVNGLKLEGPAFAICDDLTPLLAPSEWRGDNVVIPHRAGRLPMPMIVDEATYKLRFPIAGDVNPDDEPYAAPVPGYLSNLAILRNALDVPSIVDSPDSTLPATYTVPDYGVFTAEVQCMLDVTADLKIGTTMKFGRPGAMKRGILIMRLPDGLFSS